MSENPGTKRQCPECGAKFYDLNADPVTCPKCAFAFSPAELVQIVVPEDALPVKQVSDTRKQEVDDDEEDEVIEGMGKIEELEEMDMDDMDDVDHLEEVEDHHEDPEVDPNSDDADDEMFLDDMEDEDGLMEELDEITDYDDAEFENRQ